jgi:hypothetical protein
MKEIVRPRRLSQQDVLRLASHLTDRDRRIARDCFEFRVMTTSQIRRLYFTGTRTAAARLDVLYRLRVLDRFRPALPMGQGTAPYHWILDEAGALIVADHLDIERAKLGWQHSIAASIAHSQKLPHHVEVNEFFTRLAVEANVAGGALSEWYGERTCHHIFSGSLVADDYGVLDLPGRAPLHFLVELDRGTETTGRLREKAKTYASILPTSSLGPRQARSVRAAHRPELETCSERHGRARVQLRADRRGRIGQDSKPRLTSPVKAGSTSSSSTGSTGSAARCASSRASPRS